MPGKLFDDVSRLPGWERVDYLGHLDRENCRDVLSRSFAGLVLFHPAPNHVCAYPTKMFEYMMAGIPVIASRIGGLPETNGVRRDQIA